MSNLLASLRTSSGALDALQQSVAVSQNNVTNASTPGYARQRLRMTALEFAPSQGFMGGVKAGAAVRVMISQNRQCGSRRLFWENHDKTLPG
ncbi:MAG: flagellar basal body protein [Bryobacteraceae bacterium]